MLSPETPFPYVGSYALYEDPDAPAPQRTELVRILARRPGNDGAYAMVAFPLRDGAGGNKLVPEAGLIDGTPLSPEEERQYHDLDRHLGGRSPVKCRSTRLKALAATRDRLRGRMIWSRFMARQLAEMRRREEAEKRRRAA